MASRYASGLALGLFCLQAVSAAPLNGFEVQPFTINIGQEVPRMKDLINATQLPDREEYDGVDASKGIDLDVLKSMRQEWLNDFDWEKEQAQMNTYPQYKVNLEGLDFHFIHKRSEDPDAIPILLSHGWPGSFLEFLPVVDTLTQRGRTTNGRDVSYHVVVPSLPGVAFSTIPPGNWTLDDTARAYNTLMTEVLGYKTYAAHGTSNGALLTFTLYDSFNATNRAAHFTLLPFFPATTAELQELNVNMTELEQFEHQRSNEWTQNGTGYFLQHIYKPNTVGLALYDNPIGQLAWMGEKWIDWADARAGQYPASFLTHNEILRSVTLYYLTDSILPSMYTYAQDPDLPYVERKYKRAQTDAPMFVTFFRYSIAFWPRVLLETFGNLVQYRNHEFGGFYAGLENPPDFTQDLRDIADHWAQ